MKLTKKQSNALMNILLDLDRAELFLKKDNVAGIAMTTEHPNGASYNIVNPACSEVHSVNVVNKHIGSDITGLYSARKKLEIFLGLKELPE